MARWPKQDRSDWAMPLVGKTFWVYQRLSPAMRRRALTETLKRAYTRLHFDIFPNITKRDYFAAPTALLPFLQESVTARLGPIIWLGPEGDKGSQAKYQGIKFTKQLKKFVPIVDASVAEYILGPEVEEYWDDDEVSRIGAVLRTLTKKPIWVHRKTGEHGPWGWWRAQTWATGLAYQFTKRDMQKPGFLAHPDDVRDETTLYASRLKGVGKKFIASEYAYLRPEHKAQALGAIALQYGSVGFMNGGRL